MLRLSKLNSNPRNAATIERVMEGNNYVHAS